MSPKIIKCNTEITILYYSCPDLFCESMRWKWVITSQYIQLLIASIWFTPSTLTCQGSAFRAPISLKIYPGRMRGTRFCPLPPTSVTSKDQNVWFIGCFSMGVCSQVWTVLSPSHLKRTLSGAGLRRGMKHVPPMWLSIRRRPKIKSTGYD